MTKRTRSILLTFCIVVLLTPFGYILALEDATVSIRKICPSARVLLYEATSPGIHPVLDIMRLVRGRDFMPTTEWIIVSINHESTPLNLSFLGRFHIGVLQVKGCTVSDISLLRPGMIATFIECNLDRLPSNQASLLHTYPESPQIFYASSAETVGGLVL